MMDYIVHNLFSTEAGVIWLFLKWILVVLAAGFIGQFGKAFASYLMGRARTGLKEDLPRSDVLREEPSPGRMEKAAAQVPPETEPADRIKAGKKERKAQEKRRKKELKNLKKFFT